MSEYQKPKYDGPDRRATQRTDHADLSEGLRLKVEEFRMRRPLVHREMTPDELKTHDPDGNPRAASFDEYAAQRRADMPEEIVTKPDNATLEERRKNVIAPGEGGWVPPAWFPYAAGAFAAVCASAAIALAAIGTLPALIAAAALGGLGTFIGTTFGIKSAGPRKDA